MGHHHFVLGLDLMLVPVLMAGRRLQVHGKWSPEKGSLQWLQWINVYYMKDDSYLSMQGMACPFLSINILFFLTMLPTCSRLSRTSLDICVVALILGRPKGRGGVGALQYLHSNRRFMSHIQVYTVTKELCELCCAGGGGGGGVTKAHVITR